MPADRAESGVDRFGATTFSFVGAVPPCASLVWLATSVLYFLDLPNLPDPAIALVASTALALVAAGVVGVLGSNGRPAPVAPRSSELATPTSVPGSPVQPTRVQPTPVHTAEPPPNPPLPTPAPFVLDRRRYPPVDPAERQCTYCGGFEVAVEPDRPGGPAWQCRTCSTTGPLDPAVVPDVIVRSWLHQ
jgi:hypothetical protein